MEMWGLRSHSVGMIIIMVLVVVVKLYYDLINSFILFYFFALLIERENMADEGSLGIEK